MPNRAVIDVYFAKEPFVDSRRWTAIAHEDYVEELTEDCDQHERFTTPTGVIHVVVWNGKMSYASCYSLALMYAKREFVAVPLNEIVNKPKANSADAEREV